MMKKFVLIVLVVVLAGCTSATIKRDGDNCEATYSSFWKESREIGVSACGADGMASGSAPNNDIATAIIHLLGSRAVK